MEVKTQIQRSNQRRGGSVDVSLTFKSLKVKHRVTLELRVEVKSVSEAGSGRGKSQRPGWSKSDTHQFYESSRCN